MEKDNADELLLGVLWQCCLDGNGRIDNMCISAYEDACDYLAKKGYLKTKNGRIYWVNGERYFVMPKKER